MIPILAKLVYTITHIFNINETGVFGRHQSVRQQCSIRLCVEFLFVIESVVVCIFVYYNVCLYGVRLALI